MKRVVHALSAPMAWAATAALLAVGLPLFLCMPVWVDATHYDLAARNVLTGGVPYRDIFDQNTPGMVWLHMAVRSLLGWSFPALRLADIVVYAGIVALLSHWLARAGLGRAPRAWTSFGLFAFYLSLTEWCHCQRDTWMLLPALAALHLRLGQVESARRGAAGLAAGLAEGVLWGAACWIKPVVALPALAAALVSAATARRAGRPFRAGAAAAGAGALLTLAAGSLWLWSRGAWPYFCEDVFAWGGDYAAEPLGAVTRTRLLLRQACPPWGLLHLPAVALAAWTLAQLALRRDEPADAPRVLLAAFYLGWLVQAAYIQKAFYYHLTPTVPLALAVVVAVAGRGRTESSDRPRAPQRARWAVVAAAGTWVLVAAWSHPLCSRDRVALWGRCWCEGGSAELRDQLRLVHWPECPDWVDLERVAAYLRAQGVGDADVLCYNNSTHPIYLALGVRPATPYLHCDTILRLFPHHRAEVEHLLEISRQRFVVRDARAAPLPEGVGAGCPTSRSVVYRSGRYLVHRVGAPE